MNLVLLNDFLGLIITTLLIIILPWGYAQWTKNNERRKSWGAIIRDLGMGIMSGGIVGWALTDVWMAIGGVIIGSILIVEGEMIKNIK